MSKLGIQDLAAVLSQKRGLTKAQAEKFVASLFDVVNYGLDTDQLVKMKGFGTFKITNVKDRESINVNTGERVVINGHGKISFTPEAVLRDMVNKPFSQFETVVLNDGVDFSQFDEEHLEHEEPSEDTPAEASSPIEEAPQETEETAVPETKEEPSAPAVESAVPPVQAQEEETPVEVATASEDIAAEQSTPEPAHTPEPAQEEQQPIEEQADDASEEEDEEEDDSSSQSVWKPILIGVAFVAFAALVGALGYYMGARSGSDTPARQPVAAAADTAIQVKQPVSKPAVTETADTAKPVVNVGVSTTADADARKAQKDEVEEASQKKEQPKAEPIKKQEKAAAEVEDMASKYAKMDARVRTGAYAIVGVSRVVTAKPGETLQRIADRNLGPGMECYVEVINGKRTIQAGDKVKIPELRLKKRMKEK